MVVVSGGVLVLILFLFCVLLYLMYKLGGSQKESEWQKKLVSLRGKIAEKQRASVKGNVAETFAPMLGDFPFKPSECKFLGDPIDYVVFEGLDERNVTGIHFVDVKADTADLSTHQRQIRDIIAKDGKITFVTYKMKT